MCCDASTATVTSPLARCLICLQRRSTPGQQTSAKPPEGARPQSAQPCALTNLSETSRDHRHPLLIPRSLVRAQHGPSDTRESETHSARRSRESEGSRRPAPHEESQGRRPKPKREGPLKRGELRDSCHTGCRLGQHEVNNSRANTLAFRAHSRRGWDMSQPVPEFRPALPAGLQLDCELARDRRERPTGLADNDASYSERRTLLEELVMENERVGLVATFEDGPAACARGLKASSQSGDATQPISARRQSAGEDEESCHPPARRGTRRSRPPSAAYVVSTINRTSVLSQFESCRSSTMR